MLYGGPDPIFNSCSDSSFFTSARPHSFPHVHAFFSHSSAYIQLPYGPLDATSFRKCFSKGNKCPWILKHWFAGSPEIFYWFQSPFVSPYSWKSETISQGGHFRNSLRSEFSLWPFLVSLCSVSSHRNASHRSKRFFSAEQKIEMRTRFLRADHKA